MSDRHVSGVHSSHAKLWRLAMSDGGWTTPGDPVHPAACRSRRLDDRTRALVRLGALVATGAGPMSYQRQVAEAHAAGATDEEVLDTLIAVSPTVGLAHLVSATVGLALALGYDIDAAFEGTDQVAHDQDISRGAGGR